MVVPFHVIFPSFKGFKKILVLIPVNFFSLVAANETLDIRFVVGRLHAAKFKLDATRYRKLYSGPGKLDQKPGLN